MAALNQANSAAAAQAAANAAAERAAAERAAFEADLAQDNIIAEPTSTTRPVYNFEYKVADDTAQTYISQNEARDGDNLSGTYSYVDANGGLVTVNYQAGPMGYSETREVQDGFVKIVAKPTQAEVDADAVTIARAAAEARRIEAASLEAARLEAARVEAARLEAARLEAARVKASRLEATRVEAARLEAERLEASRLETVSVDQSSLIARVLATLQPLISQTVQEVVSSSSTSSTSLSSSSTSDSSVTTGDVSSTFGTNGLSVSVETPEFQFSF